MSKNKRTPPSGTVKPRFKSNSPAQSQAKPFNLKKSKVKPSQAQSFKAQSFKAQSFIAKLPEARPKEVKPVIEAKKKTRQRRTSDLRIRRTRSRLSNALVELMRDKPIDQITVQEVLDHAGVGRSTFYLHYRDKDDLFLDQMENGMEMWSTLLMERHEKSNRLAPVEEFFAHAASARNFYRALIDSGRIHAFFDLAEGCFARGIARRLREIEARAVVSLTLSAKNPAAANLHGLSLSLKHKSPGQKHPEPKTPDQKKLRPANNAGRDLDARSYALAGNLLSLLKWWLDHGAKEPPRAMDELFHGIAWKGLQGEKN